ncbi:MAG: serine/threonine-protein kinase, partial [Myxococcota bacterium]
MTRNPEPSEHPEFDDLVAEPLSEAVVAHLERCTRCRVERQLLRGLPLPPSSRSTVSWSSIRSPTEGAGLRRLWWTPVGPLLPAHDDRGGFVLALDRDGELAHQRYEELAKADHPSLARWTELEARDGSVVARCESLPERTVHEAVEAERARLGAWLVQLGGAIAALHRAGTAHGGLHPSWIVVNASHRLIVGPPALWQQATPADDLRDLAGLLALWTEAVSHPELARLADELRHGRVTTPAELLERMYAVADPRQSSALRYEDRGPLGRGGMGEVSRVYDHVLRRVVALKVLRKDRQEHESRFLQETQLTAGLQHPGIAPVHDTGHMPDDRPFYTMEEVRGDQFTQAIRRVHAASTQHEWATTADGWSFRRLMATFERVCDTMAYAHARDIVHRDLKPDNVCVGLYGDVRVLDWGLAVSVRTHGERAGTPGYMAPEQLNGEVVDKRTDVFGLGRVLDDILHGVTRTTTGPPAPTGLLALVDQCTAMNPRDRLADASEVQRRVQHWLDGVARSERADALVDEVLPLFDEAECAMAEAQQRRKQADDVLESLETWDPPDHKAPGWALQEEARRFEGDAAVMRTRYEQGLRAALQHDPDHRRALELIGDLYRRQLVRAERTHNLDEVLRLSTLLETHDNRRHRGWLRGDGVLTLVTEPPGAHVMLERLEERQKQIVPVSQEHLGTTPLREVRIGRGSWRLKITHPDCEDVIYPVLVERGGHWDGRPPEGGDPLPIAL